ncbi:hypothetical protein J2T12_000565 [Paenibacillus anaericanus]|nr:hypothetical protein [Paenibacillus anaericanus]
MIYHFISPDPFQLVFIFCPIIAIILGIVFAQLRWKQVIAPLAGFLLPLLYITTDWNSFKVNLEAWFLWGILYAIIAYVAGWITNKRKHRT